MARTWLSITVELVSGRGEDFWPRPGRVFVAARSHTFAALAEAINAGFARWDLSHLSRFDLADGTTIANTDPFFDAPEDTVEIGTAKLSTLKLGDQFVYTFDFGDDWHHLCTVGPERVDPEEVYGITPNRPVPYWGWGGLPDQYGRRQRRGPCPARPRGAGPPGVLSTLALASRAPVTKAWNAAWSIPITSGRPRPQPQPLLRRPRRPIQHVREVRQR